MSTKAQVWVMDYMVAMVIFSLAFTVFLKSLPNLETEDYARRTYMDAKTMSSMILSEGYPENWNLSNVKRIGILERKGDLSYDKIIMFRNLSEKKYSFTKEQLGIRSDYSIDFIYPNGTKLNFSGIGKKANDADELVQIQRVLMYNKTPVKMVVNAWK